MNAPAQIVPPYKHTPLFPLGPDQTPYRKLTTQGVRVEKIMGRDTLVIEREAIRALSEAAFTDINHLLRPGHLKQLRSILDDRPERGEMRRPQQVIDVGERRLRQRPHRLARHHQHVLPHHLLDPHPVRRNLAVAG